MLGFMISGIEQKEIEYLLKRELDEILFDLMDERIDQVVKRAMEERYKILFNILKRVASPKECFKYMRTKTSSKRKEHPSKDTWKGSQAKK
ncbi:hypothetical protein CVD28_22245 [Bacillus sp. M6-12]|uniref:hypothetical protein n=1 Tax=Bacillus sp. M6-12 TaxID=2054166 RepID=UPI000C77FA0B|nr:hypothetical protein [Bacillus sp. M6-12]PLS15582.1 hypothetical protein CVD28_22245 [Bacillus sp. M6-12]